jgi:hypothetical protein
MGQHQGKLEVTRCVLGCTERSVPPLDKRHCTVMVMVTSGGSDSLYDADL